MNRLAVSLLLVAVPAFGQDTTSENMKDCRMHAQHATHQGVVEGHGDRAMGFPHDETTHHFSLATDGGVIEVTANDPGDKANTAAIHSHLSHIAIMFSNADFSRPMFIRVGVPTGVTTMKLMNSAIHYTYEEIPLAVRFGSLQTILLLSQRSTTSCDFRLKSTKRATVLRLLCANGCTQHSRC